MYKIIEKQELNIYNLCCFRGKVTRQELQNIGLEMEKYIETCGEKKPGNALNDYMVKNKLQPMLDLLR